MYAIVYLGNVLGFPLTQTNIIISGIIGIVVFKEIQGKAIIFFALSTVIMFCGVGMLTYFGSDL